MALTQISSAGIKNAEVKTEDILDANITTAKIADDAVTADKLANAINTDIAGKAVLTGSMSNTITTVTSANNIQSEANLTFDGTTLGVAGNLVFGNTTQSKILHNTSDASDNKFLTINGGGDASQSRGAGITFYGNEVGSNEGRLWIGAGNSGSANGFINFNTAGLERARIDSSGRLLVGHTSSINSYGENSQLQVSGTGYADSTLAIRRDSADNGSGSLILSKSRGSQGGVTIVQSGDKLGSIVWCGADGTDANSSAGGIQCVVDGTPGVNDMPGRLEFYTTNDGVGGISEKMRIDSSGRVGINNTNMSSFNNGFDDLVIGNGTANTSPGMTIYSHATDIGSISFRDSADTGISGLIQYRHMESSPYMRVMIEGTERVKFTTDGICFGSDTAAANALDDYEEGTYTPVLSGTDNWTGTSSTADANYVKIGNVCFVTIAYASNSMSGIGGTAVLRVNLPFTSKASGNNVGQACVSEWSIGSSSISWMGAKINNNEGYARFQYHNGNNNNTNDLTKDAANNQMNFRCTITYITA